MKNEKSKPEEAQPIEKAEYPYGICLHLSREELIKLGFKGLPKIGEVFMVDAKCEVTEVSMGAGKDHEYASASLQITEMELEESEEEEEDDGKTASMMFDKMK